MDCAPPRFLPPPFAKGPTILTTPKSFIIMANGDPLPYLFDLLSVTRLVLDFQIVAATIYIWDYILTFDMELELVWKSRWTTMTGVYLFQRYLPFIEVTLTLYYQTGESLTKHTCRNLSFSGGVLTGLGLAASEVILMLRTWAVWNRNRRLSIILPILFSLFTGSGLVIGIIYLNSVEYSDPPYPRFKGCFPTYAHKYDLVILSALSTIWDSMMLTLILIPGARAFRSGGNSALVKTVYRDGVIYYLYIFVFSFLNIVILATLPNQSFLYMVSQVLCTLLTSRVFLDIRAQMGVQPVQADGLTELNTNHLRAGDTQFSRLEEIKFSTTKRSSL